MKWAINLILENETIEGRLLTIVEYVVKNHRTVKCQIDDLDATGRFGNQLTKELNQQQTALLDCQEFIEILKEDGQIFELRMTLKSVECTYLMIVRRGDYVDIVGDELLPPSVVGRHTELDIGFYNF